MVQKKYNQEITPKVVTSNLKQGEINAIVANLSNAKSGKYKQNAVNYTKGSGIIFLAENNHILLRTNGCVNTGYYDATGTGNFLKDNEYLFKFTHNVNVPEFRKKVFVEELHKICLQDQCKFKETVFQAYDALCRSNSNIRIKRRCVEYVLNNPDKFRQASDNMNLSTVKEDYKEIKQINKQNTISKEDDKMNKQVKVNVDNMNVMAVAHMIRRELKLEGAYAAQMKYALKLAWEVKRGENDLNNILGEDATVSTYDVANDVKAPADEAKNQSNDVKAPADNKFTYEQLSNISKNVSDEPLYNIYLEFDNGMSELKIKDNKTDEVTDFKLLNGRNVKLASRNLSEGYQGLFKLDKNLKLILEACPSNCEVIISSKLYGNIQKGKNEDMLYLKKLAIKKCAKLTTFSVNKNKEITAFVKTDETKTEVEAL